MSVKQQVNDINSTLTGLLSELKELRGTIDSQHSEICSLNRNIDKLLKENRDYAPRKRGGNAITFGKNIRAVATYLNVVQCMPYERLQSLFETMFNVRISQGTLANIVREMLEKSCPAIDLIERMIRGSAIVGFDESGCYTNGKLNWSWIAQTTYLTLHT